jgi:flagellar protein FlaF
MSYPQTNSYRVPPAPGNPRQVEAWALTETALRMQSAKTHGDKEAMQDAVRLNWRLWTLFQAEILDPQCLLPEPIRGNMVALAAFVDKHTLAVFSDFSPEQLDVLININRQLAMGLHGDGGAGSEAQSPEPAADAERPASLTVSV